MSTLIEVMPWVRRLPEIGTPILSQLEALQRLVDEAEAAAHKARDLQACALIGAEELKTRLADFWSDEEIALAKAASNAAPPALLTPEQEARRQANLAKLPPVSYAVYVGGEVGRRIVVVKAGERGHTESCNESAGMTLFEVRERVELLNAALGVSKVQAAAMWTGSLYGFHVPGADVDLRGDEGPGLARLVDQEHDPVVAVPLLAA